MKKGNSLAMMWLTLSLGLVLVALPLLGGCAAPPPAEKPSAVPPPAAPPPGGGAKPDARLEALIEGAKKEGEVVFWTNTSPRFEAVITAFREKYPFLSVKMWDSKNIEMLTKATIEAKVGRVSYDLMYTSYFIADMLQKDGLLVEYDWPNAQGWVQQPPHKYWLNQGASLKLPFYHTELIPPAEAPKSWEDLNNPKYKQYEVLISSSSDELPLQMAYMWGEAGKLNWEKTFKYWTEVVKNTEPRVERGYGKPMELIAAGEAGLFLSSSWNRGMLYVQKGAPVDFVRTTPIGSYRSYVMPKDAPHPHAGMLLADFLTTPEAELSIANDGMVNSLSPEVAKEAVPNKYIKDAGLESVTTPVELMTEENFQKSEDFWFTLLGLK
jgi:iron(III) transport system substrate-binding protein